MITRELIKNALDNGVIQILDEAPDYGCVSLCCKIGNNAFYFAGMDFENMTAKEYLENADVVEDLYNILSSPDHAPVEMDEYNYYIGVLEGDFAPVSRMYLVQCPVSEETSAEKITVGVFENAALADAAIQECVDNRIALDHYDAITDTIDNNTAAFFRKWDDMDDVEDGYAITMTLAEILSNADNIIAWPCAEEGHLLFKTKDGPNTWADIYHKNSDPWFEMDLEENSDAMLCIAALSADADDYIVTEIPFNLNVALN